MQVSKWGNSLAIRIPVSIVEALDLKEGDHVDVKLAGTREFSIDRDTSREEALKHLRARRIPFPEGWKFDRDEANER